MNGWQRLFLFLMGLVGFPLIAIGLLARPESPYSEYVYSCSPEYIQPGLEDISELLKTSGSVTQNQAKAYVEKIWGLPESEKIVPKLIVKIVDKERDGSVITSRSTYQVTDSAGEQFNLYISHLDGSSERKEADVKAHAQKFINIRYRQGQESQAMDQKSNSLKRLRRFDPSVTINSEYLDAPWLDDELIVPFSDECRKHLTKIASGESESKAWREWVSDLRGGAIWFISFFAVLYAMGWGVAWVVRGFKKAK